jgi:hypothetical protein
MGCGPSKESHRLQTVDDSVHVMLTHDKKMQKLKGAEPHGYVPRSEHPLLTRKAPNVIAVEEEEQGNEKESQPSTASTGLLSQ